VMLSTGGSIDSSTTGAGDGGAINVNASTEVNVSSGGSIRADSSGSGFTGQITVIAGDRIVMENGSISTRAATSDGGDIVLNAPNLIRLENSQVTTSVESSTGGGGNISIDPEFMILQGTTISANAFGGPGGNVTIVANNFVADAFTSITASSALSTPGTVQIQSPDNNLASDIAQLPSAPIDASRLMQGSCSARRASAPSSFQVAGRGGVPADPDGYLPSFGASGAPFAPQASQTPRLALAMAGWDCWR
jgi:large exoprotein involved in heme utilization and adhesion